MDVSALATTGPLPAILLQLAPAAPGLAPAGEKAPAFAEAFPQLLLLLTEGGTPEPAPELPDPGGPPPDAPPPTPLKVSVAPSSEIGGSTVPDAAGPGGADAYNPRPRRRLAEPDEERNSAPMAAGNANAVIAIKDIAVAPAPLEAAAPIGPEPDPIPDTPAPLARPAPAPEAAVSGSLPERREESVMSRPEFDWKIQGAPEDAHVHVVRETPAVTPATEQARAPMSAVDRVLAGASAVWRPQEFVRQNAIPKAPLQDAPPVELRSAPAPAAPSERNPLPEVEGLPPAIVVAAPERSIDLKEDARPQEPRSIEVDAAVPTELRPPRPPVEGCAPDIALVPVARKRPEAVRVVQIPVTVEPPSPSPEFPTPLIPPALPRAEKLLRAQSPFVAGMRPSPASEVLPDVSVPPSGSNSGPEAAPPVSRDRAEVAFALHLTPAPASEERVPVRPAESPSAETEPPGPERIEKTNVAEPDAPVAPQRPRRASAPEPPHAEPLYQAPARTTVQPVATAAVSREHSLESSRTEPPKPAPPSAPATPEPPVALKPSAPARDIKLELSGGERRVEVRLSERGGELRVAVRTPDSNLAGTLRENLPGLSSRLAESGFRTETWHPTTAAPDGEWRRGTETSAGNQAQDSGQNSGQESGRQGDGRNSGDADPRRPKDNIETIERKEKGKDFAWLMSSLQ